MEIVLIIGAVCSGKNTYAKRYESLRTATIDIGDIVRDITKTQLRVIDSSLDRKIIRRLADMLINIERREQDVLITGIRQLSILEFIETYNNNGSPKSIVYLDTPKEIREQYFYERAAEKDKGITYDQIMEKEIQLGYGKLEEYILDENENKMCIIPVIRIKA